MKLQTVWLFCTGQSVTVKLKSFVSIWKEDNKPFLSWGASALGFHSLPQIAEMEEVSSDHMCFWNPIQPIKSLRINIDTRITGYETEKKVFWVEFTPVIKWFRPLRVQYILHQKGRERFFIWEDSTDVNISRDQVLSYRLEGMANWI